MMAEEKVQRMEVGRSLRVVSPKLYHLVMEELEKIHVHSYDVQMYGTEDEDGVHLSIKYGGQFNHEAADFFSHQAIDAGDEAIAAFARKAGEECQEVLKREYFKMMRP